MSWAPVVTAVLDRLVTFALAGAVASAVALLVPFAPLRAMAAPYDGIFVIAFAACATVLLVEAVKAARVSRAERSASDTTRTAEVIHKILESLTADELSLLGEFVRNGQRSLELPASLPELRTLLDMQLIDCREHPAVLGAHFKALFTIRNDVWDWCQKNKPPPGELGQD